MSKFKNFKILKFILELEIGNFEILIYVFINAQKN